MNTSKQWVTAYASVAGVGHIQYDIPCQDNCAYSSVEGGIWRVAVVCDGAGSAAHSEKGSLFVSQNIAECLEQILKRNNWHTSPTLPNPTTWRTEAVQALQLVRQRLEAYAKETQIELKDLACTVVTAIYSEAGVLEAHIGDGRAGYRTETGEWKALMTPFRGEEANQTVFITSNIWTQEGVDIYVQTSVLEQPITAIALTSDGCEKGSFLVNVYNEETKKYEDLNQPYKQFFEPNVQGLLSLHKEGKSQTEINELWRGFLTDGHKQFKHEIDDKTLILSVLAS